MTLCHKDLHAALLCHLPTGLTSWPDAPISTVGRWVNKHSSLTRQHTSSCTRDLWTVKPGLECPAMHLQKKTALWPPLLYCVMSQAHACDKEVGTSPERELRKPSLRLYSTSHIAKCLIYFAEVFWSTDGSLLSCSSDDVQQRSDVFPWCRETTQSFDNLQVC